MSTLSPANERAFRLAVSPIRDVVVRDASTSGDGSWIVEGYAAVFEQETVLYDGKWFRVKEIISADAFGPVLARVAAGDELVHLNHGHNMESAVAATDVSGIGGLSLTADAYGLKFTARVDPEDPDAVRMAVKLRRRVVAQASFAFTIAEEELTIRDGEDGKEEDFYRILEIGSLYDVCVTAQGAYPQTESYVRSLAAASLGVPIGGTHGRSDLESEGQQRRPGEEPEGASQVVPAEVGPAATGAHARAKAQVDARFQSLTRRDTK